MRCDPGFDLLTHTESEISTYRVGWSTAKLFFINLFLGMLQCIRAAQSTTPTPHTSLEQSPLHHCNTVISQNLADTRVGTSTGGVQSACFYGSLTCLSRCLRPQFRPLHPDERVCNPARNEIRVLTPAEPPHVVAQRTARPGEVRPPMADALHACAAACHARHGR